MRLSAVGKLHTLLAVLSRPECVCVWPVRRAVSRLWLDASVSRRTIRHARRLGLVRVEFENPYIIGRGEDFVGLTGLGAFIAHVHPSQARPS